MKQFLMNILIVIIHCCTKHKQCKFINQNSDMNILLIGIRGSGKTTIGTLLAKKLKYTFIEFDQQILAHTGYDKVHDVLGVNGYLWTECELELSKDLGSSDNLVIATGGGFVENKLNIVYFKDQNPDTVVIYLSAKPETIARRNSILAGEQEKIPYQKLLKNVQFIYSTRGFLYDLHADITLSTDGKEPTTVIDEIYKALQQLKSQSATY